MKYILIKVTTVLVFIIVILTACNIKENKEDNLSVVKGKNYNEVIEKGLKREGLSLQDVLYEETIGENKILYITSHNALGLVYMSREEDDWIWSRITSYTDFQTDLNSSSPYMAGGTEIKAPDGKTYFLAMGKIFNSNIAKLTLYDDRINVNIKKKSGNIFWFKLLENKDLYKNIKIYDKEGKELKY